MDIIRLSKKIEEFTKTDWKKYPTYEHALQEWVECLLREETEELKTELKTAYRKGMRHMAKALKDYDRKFGAWTDYFEHTVDTVLQKEQVAFEEYGTLADQLLKAKSILTLFLVANDNDDMFKAQREAWAFLGTVDTNARFEVTEKGKEYLSSH